MVEYFNQRNVVFTGDSRIATMIDTVRIGTGGPVFPESGDLAVNRYGINKRNILNIAILGIHSHDITDQVPQILSLNPQKVVIQVGVLDCFGQSVNPWPDRQSAWVGILSGLASVKHVVIMETMYLTQAAYTDNDFTQDVQRQYNDNLKALCATYPNVQYVELNKYMIGSDGFMIPSYTWDGIHPSYSGFQKFWISLDPVTWY